MVDSENKKPVLERKRVTVRRDIQLESKLNAQRERERLTKRGTLVVNLVSSPGAGKTSLLEKIGQRWLGSYRMAVLVGDVETDRDARRLEPYFPVAQLTTGGACHLELPLVRRGLEAIGDPDLDFLVIENIGNLVCPASHDLAEHVRVTMLSVTEGDDKPAKYPKMFRTSHALIISKSDLLPYVPFDPELAIQDARTIQPKLMAFTLSAVDGSGIDAFCLWLEQQRREHVLVPKTT